MSTTLIKHVHASVKLTERGTGIARVTSLETDVQNDRFVAETFAHQDGDVVPVSFAHLVGFGDPTAVIGTATLEVRDGIVHARFRLDLNGVNGKLAQFVYERMRLPADDERHLGEWSIGLMWSDDDAHKGPDGERVITRADILEVSIVPQGAQSNTATLELKRASGRPSTSRAGRTPNLRDQLAKQYGAELVREVLGPTREEVAADAARKARVREEHEHRCKLETMTPRRRVLIDARFRAHFPDEAERDRDRREREERSMTQRAADREAELARIERERAAVVKMDEYGAPVR